MDPAFLERLVLLDGTLDSARLYSRETLYKGRNGKTVERFTPRGSTDSFVFKPLTNEDTFGREQWVYTQLLPDLPVQYPVMLAYGKHNDPQKHWAVFEDMGRLEHRFDAYMLVRAARAIPLWHQVAPDRIPHNFTGHTPYVDQILKEVIDRMAECRVILSMAGIRNDRRARLEKMLGSCGGTCETEKKVSHGDYHPLNLALREGELIILDWEYTHCNSIYWDLYNLLDMTSPKYRRPAYAPHVRDQVLQAYWSARGSLESEGAFESFKHHYYSYAIIYSLWILMLIQKDISTASFDLASLQVQQAETLHILSECIPHYFWTEG